MDQKGQSTIEFALTLILLIAVILFFFQVSFVIAFGNYVHYATFMSARAFRSAGNTLDDQKSRARDVIVMMLKKSIGQSGVDRFPSIAKGVGDGDPPGFQIISKRSDPNLSWMEGVRYTFKSKLFVVPFAGSSRPSNNTGPNQANTISLTSESWLGRDPAEDECRIKMQAVQGIIDNGC